MISKYFKIILLFVLLLGFSISNSTAVEASSKVMWGKTELKLGQIGKVTVLTTTPLVRLASDGSIPTVRYLEKGEEYRVYSVKRNPGLYGVGGGNYIYLGKEVKYETPSKSKLALLDGKGTNEIETPAKLTKPTPAKDKNTVYKEKLEVVKNTQYKNYKEYADAVYKLQNEINNDKENFQGKYDLMMQIGELYYRDGIIVDEMVFTFDNGISLLAYRRSPSEYNNNLANRSAIYYNNKYYLDMHLVQLILSADLNLYHFDKPEPSNSYDGKFTINGTTYNYGSEFKDESNKSLGAYSSIYLVNPVNNKTLTISEKEFPFAGKTGNLLNPYSTDEVKDILGIQFEESFDSKIGKLTIHFNKLAKDKYPGW